jgi:hypothetical protein
MEKTDAVRLMNFVEQFGAAFNDATAVTLELRDVSEAKKVRKLLSEMATKSFELSEMIVGQYPELGARN